MADRSVRVYLEAVTSRYQAAMAKAGASTRSFAKQVDTMGTKNKQQMDTIGIGAVAVGGAMVYGFSKAVGASMEFEKAMSGVKAVSGATTSEMESLSAAALQAGADTVFSATESAEAEAELVKAGISVEDVLSGGLTGALDLAAAGQLDLADAATIAAQAMNVFNLQGEDVTDIADTLAAGANKSAADVSQLGEALRQGGLVAQQTGIGLHGTVGALSAFADNALIGSDAGTSFKTMLQRLTPQSVKAKTLMDELGISAYDSQGNFIGLAEFAGVLQDALKDLTPQQRNAAMATMFGSDAVRGANILYSEGEQGIREYISAVNDQGAAQKMAADQLDNLAGDIEAFKGSLETALIEGGTAANSFLRGITQFGTEAINVYTDLPPGMQQLTTIFIGLGGAVTLTGGAMLLLIPRIAATKAAMIELGLASRAASIAMTGLPLTILIGTAIAAKTAIDGTAESIDGLTNATRSNVAMGGVEGISPEQAQTFEQAKDQAAALVGELEAAGAIKPNFDWLTALHENLGELGTNYAEASPEQFAAAVNAMRDDLAGAAGGAKGLAGGIDQVGDSAEETTGKLRDLRLEQLQAAGGFLGVQGAAMSLADAQEAVADAQAKVNRLVNAGKKGTPAYKEALAGLETANADVILSQMGLTEAVNGFLKDLSEGKMTQQEAIDLVRAYGEKAGLSKDAVGDLVKMVKELIKENRNLPTDKQTNYKAPGLNEQLLKLKTLKGYLEGLKPEYRTTVITQYKRTGGFQHPAPVEHSGGMVGSTSGAVRVSGAMRSDEVSLIAQRGEVVLSRAQARQGSGQSISISFGNIIAESDPHKLKRAIREGVEEALDRIDVHESPRMTA